MALILGMVGMVGMVGVPLSAIGVVFGVDRFLDMCRTMLNVTGELAIATIVNRRGFPATTEGSA